MSVPVSNIGKVFLAVAVVLLADATWVLWRGVQAQGWTQVPAVVSQLDVSVDHRRVSVSGSRAGRGLRVTLKVEYAYAWKGVTHTNQTFALRPLISWVEYYAGRPFYAVTGRTRDGATYCFVNPADPEEAVLSLHPPWYLVSRQNLIALLLFSAGLVLQSFRPTARSEDPERRRAHPLEPWLWRADWAEGRVIHGSGFPTRILVCAGVWTLMSYPPLILRWLYPADVAEPLPWLPYVAPVLVIPLLAVAVNHFLDHRKFGGSCCRFHPLPLHPGDRMDGTLELVPVCAQATEFHVALVCREMVSLPNQKGTRLEIREWLSFTVPSPGPQAGDSVRIPFALEIPVEAPCMPAQSIQGWPSWHLRVSAELTRLDFDAYFELPVYAADAVGTPKAEPGLRPGCP